MTKKRKKTEPPKIVPGNWHAELLGAGSAHLGGTINLSPSPHAIEFSWMTLSAVAHGPGNITFPAAIVLMAPAKAVSHEYPGSMTHNGLVTMIDFSVTRPLFSDLLARIESGKVKTITFEVKEGNNNTWPISSWGVALNLPSQ